MLLDYRNLIQALVGRCDERTAVHALRFPSLHPVMRLKNAFDRRISPRFRTNIPVVVYRDGLTYPAVMCDVSKEGIGLRDVTRLHVGERVTVEISPAMIVRGEVVWWDKHRAGLLLSS